MSINSNCGTYLPITTRQTVRGVESSNPTGPQSHVQNTAATSTANADMPVLAPYQNGSTTWLITISITSNKTMVARNGAYPEHSAIDSASGNAAPIQIPI